MAEPTFEKSVFINCPLDEEYEGILQAILFCIVYLGFHPRIATERADSAESRLSKIIELIEASKYSVHDLSRSQASAAGEHFRLNMPFELGIDFGCRRYAEGCADKKILILEQRRYQLKAALSDLAGCDVEPRGNNFGNAMRKVRNWLVSEAGAAKVGASSILGKYINFQQWYYETQLAAGFSEEDIKDYPTSELLDAMNEWIDAGQPL